MQNHWSLNIFLYLFNFFLFVDTELNLTEQTSDCHIFQSQESVLMFQQSASHFPHLPLSRHLMKLVIYTIFPSFLPLSPPACLFQ